MATSTTFDNCSVKGELIDCDKPDFYMFNSGIRMIALGSDFCLTLDVKGNVLSWGECSSALGMGKIDSRQLDPAKIYFKEISYNLNLPVTYIVAGSNFAAAVTESNKLFMWGNNAYGQLGLNEREFPELYIPTQVNLDLPVLFVACGLYHTVCITEFYRVFAWGINRSGQLGLNHSYNVSQPQEVESLRGECIAYVACGFDNTMAVSEDGRVFGWGNNAYYKMGVESNRYRPDQLDAGRNSSTPSKYDLNFGKFGRPNEFPKMIKLEKKFSMCITTFDRYFWWGLHPNNDYYNQKPKERDKLLINDPEFLFGLTHVPLSDEHDQEQPFQVPDAGYFPVKVAAGKLITSLITLEKPKNDDDGRYAKTKFFSQIQCGDNYTIALTGFGELMVWGSNLNGQHGTLPEDISKTYKEFFITGLAKKTDPKYRIECFPHFINYFGIDSNKRITYFSCGARHVLAIQNGIALYAWGDNTSGQLGIQQPTTASVSKPHRINSLSGTLIKACEAGDDVSAIIVGNLSEVYTCGSNAEGKLGQAIPYRNLVHAFTKIEGFQRVQRLSIGRNHVLAICQVKSQADNIFDELSRAEDDDSPQQKQMGKDQEFQTEVFSWGNGAVGQLGTGKLESSNYPTKLEVKGDFSMVSAGMQHSGVITTDGRLYLWGLCSYLPRNFIDEIDRLPEGGKPKIFTRGKDKILAVPYELRMKNKNSIVVSFKGVHLRDSYNMVTARDTMGDKVYQWGMFMKDKEERNDRDAISKANDMVEIENLWASDVAVGYDHAALISTDCERVYCWGVDNYSGKIGNTVEISQGKKGAKNQSNDPSGELSQALQVIHEPTETISLYSILALRIDEIHKKNVKVVEDKDAKSTSKSGLASETTMDKSAVTDTSMSGGNERSKAQMKAKYYHLLSDEYLDYLKHAAQQAFLAMVQLMEEYRAILDKRDEAIKKLKNFLFCRITEEPFNLPIRNPWEKKQFNIMADELTNLVFTHTFTAMQFHPCLLVRLIEPTINGEDSTPFEPAKFASLVWQIYGSIQFDQRKENLYTNLFDLILKRELKGATFFNKIRLYEGNLYNSFYEKLDSPGMISLKYSSALLERAITESIDREEEIDKMYKRLIGEINLRTKSLEDIQKPFAFCMWENSELTARYQSENATWRIDEFMERVNNLQKLASMQFLNQDTITKVRSQHLVYNLLTKLNTALMGFKDYKDTEKKKNMLGYLLLPLKSKINKELTRMDGKSKKLYELNLNHCYLFLLHYSTGNKITVHNEADIKDMNKDNDRWITKLNEAIFSSDTATLELKTNADLLFGNQEREQEDFFVDVDTKVQEVTRQLGIGEPETDADGEEKTEKSFSPDDHQTSVFKNLILYVKQVMDTNTERITMSKSLIYEVFSRIIDNNVKADLYEDLRLSIKQTEFRSTLDELQDDEGCVNIDLLNKEYVLTKTLDLKQCSECGIFAPSQVIDNEFSYSLITDFLKEKKGSPLYIFMNLILNLKHDRHYLNKMWNDHNAMTEKELKNKEEVVPDLGTKQSLRAMQELIRKSRMEMKVDVDNFKNTLGGGSDNESFLEKLHLTLKNQVRDQVVSRSSYATMMKHIYNYIHYYLMVQIKSSMDNISKSLETSTEIAKGKKHHHDMECLLYNIKLGFSNWPEADAFDKEGKFVKRLRLSIYKQGVSQLIFQDLTKNEKALISTKMFIDNKETKKLVDVSRFNDLV